MLYFNNTCLTLNHSDIDGAPYCGKQVTMLVEDEHFYQPEVNSCWSPEWVVYGVMGPN